MNATEGGQDLSIDILNSTPWQSLPTLNSPDVCSPGLGSHSTSRGDQHLGCMSQKDEFFILQDCLVCIVMVLELATVLGSTDIKLHVTGCIPWLHVFN